MVGVNFEWRRKKMKKKIVEDKLYCHRPHALPQKKDDGVIF